MEYFQPLPAFDPHVSQILGSFWQILSAKSGSVLSACEQVDEETGVDMQRSARDVLLIIGLLLVQMHEVHKESQNNLVWCLSIGDRLLYETLKA